MAFLLVNVVALVALVLPIWSTPVRNIVYPLVGVALGVMKVLDDMSEGTLRSAASTRRLQQGIFYASLARTSMHVWLVWAKYGEAARLLERTVDAAATNEGLNLHSVVPLADAVLLLVSNLQYHIACAVMAAVLYGSEVPLDGARDAIAVYGPPVVQWKKESSVVKCIARTLRAMLWCGVLYHKSEYQHMVPHIAQGVSLVLEATVQQAVGGAGKFLPRLSKRFCGALQCVYSLLNLLLVTLL